MNVAVGLEVLLNWLKFRLGPLEIDQAPVPTVGEFAASVALAVVQIICGKPAFEVVGTAFTVMVTLLMEAAQGAFEIVQTST